MTTAPAAQIDLTAPSDVEILTPAGIVRVNTNLVNTQTLAPVVVVEIQPNTSGRRLTASGGHWVTELTHRPGDRVDVTLTKDG
jgi:hypothetical protein